jgi:hypothetical protein
MLDFSKSITLIGLDVMEEMLHVLLKLTIIVQYIFMEDGAIHLKHGVHIQHVDADSDCLR